MNVNVDKGKNERELSESSKNMNYFFTDNAKLIRLKTAYNSYINSWDAFSHIGTSFEIILKKNGQVSSKLSIFKVFLKNAK
jgi:hypothetical protein